MITKPDASAVSAGTTRVEALARYSILDTEPEPAFDDIVLLATRICETPVALVSLVTQDRQWFKARIGFPSCETPLGQSVCAHALVEDDVLIIPDLTLDPRTRDNTLVTEDPSIRFYAGALLKTAEGTPLGTLCVIDTEPRPQGLSALQIDSLKALSRQIMDQMELRRVIAQRDQALVTASEADAAFKAKQQMLKSELDHRLKNVLALVHSLVSQTLRSSGSLDEARRAVSARIVALGKAQEILLDGRSEGASLASIVQDVVALHDDAESRFRVDGPAIEAGPRATLSIALTLHELATNARKYGSLSTPAGGIAIDWKVMADDDEPYLALVWREFDGPAVTLPLRKGFGSRLIERALPAEVGARIALTYPGTGVECHVSIPLSGLNGAH